MPHTYWAGKPESGRRMGHIRPQWGTHDRNGTLMTVTFFKNTIFVSSHVYPENPEGTQIIVGSMNMGYISDTARNRTHNLFRPKREPIPLGHCDGQGTHNRNGTPMTVMGHPWPQWGTTTFIIYVVHISIEFSWISWSWPKFGRWRR